MFFHGCSAFQTVSRMENIADMIFHDYYKLRRIDDRVEDTTFENVDNVDTKYLTQSQKHGDELLIDLVRSRPFLYDKKLIEYRDNNMKENAWAEISSILENSGNLYLTECFIKSFFQ